jgi:hypothetical protein
MNTSQFTELIKRVGADHRLQRTEDTSLLSEERHLMDLSPLFENLTKSTSLQDAVSLLQWLELVALYERAKAEQNNLRKALQLLPDTDSPWVKSAVPRLEG